MRMEGFFMAVYYAKEWDDELLLFFILLSHIWKAKYNKHSLLFFVLILLQYS